MRKCLPVHLFKSSLPSKIGGNFPPQLSIPFQNCIILQFIFLQPVFGTADHYKQRRIARSVFQIRFALARVDPGDPVFRIRINRQVRFVPCHPRQSMDDCQKLTDIVRAIRKRAKVKDLFCRLGKHAAIFKPARRSTTGCIHADGWEDRLHAGFLPLSQRRGCAFVGFILRPEGCFRFGTRPKRLKLRARKSLHLLFALCPRRENTRLSPLPYDVVLLIWHNENTKARLFFLLPACFFHCHKNISVRD